MCFEVWKVSDNANHNDLSLILSKIPRHHFNMASTAIRAARMAALIDGVEFFDERCKFKDANYIVASNKSKSPRNLSFWR